jgi:hypothetical protein
MQPSAPIHIPTADLDLGGNAAVVINQLDEILSDSRSAGLVRSQALHIVLVRSLGGELRGYSMGLPGPMASTLPTSAVLIASRAFTDSAGYVDVTAMSETVSHEMGHYLGLYHTSEIDRLFHDPIVDTAECTVDSCPSEYWLNLMTPGASDRRELSFGQGEIVRRHPLCIPTGNEVPKDPPGADCDLSCDAPFTCAIFADQQICAVACDPAGTPCDNGSACITDDAGKYVCDAAR